MDINVALARERFLWNTGARFIAGITRVGMKALAGPIVVAAIVYAEEEYPESADLFSDLSAEGRGAAARTIKEFALCWAIEQSGVREIARHGNAGALAAAINRAIKSLPLRVDHLLLDESAQCEGIETPHTFVVSGERTSLFVSSAAILARVARTRTMLELDEAFPVYKFAAHWGFPTPAHLAALETYGLCSAHRTDVELRRMASTEERPEA